LRTTNLRFEHRPAGEPALGLGTPTPRLSWINTDAPDGAVQTASEIELTRTPWGASASTSTATLAGPDQVLVAWPGTPLASRERAEVRVRTADGAGVWGDWSEASVVEAPAPALVASLDVPAGVRSARLHLTAHGWYEVLINGTRVGDDWFGPGWTTYPKRLRYYSYDVTDRRRSCRRVRRRRVWSRTVTVWGPRRRRWRRKSPG
jgi:alpha-L-rhamnosidase